MGKTDISRPGTISIISIFSVIILCILTFSGCSVVTSTALKETSPSTIEGMVYHLPKSFLKVSIESKKDKDRNHTELEVAVIPEIVPDKNARFVLKPSKNDLFKRNHTFKFTNSLLSTIEIEDKGESGDIITNLATIAANVVKITEIPAPAEKIIRDNMCTVSEEPKPTQKEIKDALFSIAPERQDYLFGITDKDQTANLPGTAELLGFSVKIEGLPDSKPSLDSLNDYEGIVTKTLEPYQVKISLYLDLTKLYENRIAAAEKNTNQCSQVTKSNKEFREAINKCGGVSRFEIAVRSTTVSIPDYSPIIKIPLTRAPLGETKFTISLDHGILTSYQAEHPSTTLEIVKIPLNITSALVALPAEIIRLKFDYSSKQESLLEQEKKILILQQEIADLKASTLKNNSQ
jgi:hypothetical protein